MGVYAKFVGNDGNNNNSCTHPTTTNASCTTDGVCKDCKAIVEKARHLPNISSPTCTVAQVCTRCKIVLKNAKGHDPDRESATCTENKICKNCSVVIEDALGHDPDRESATCTEAQTCKRCSTLIEAALGHDYTAWNAGDESSTQHTRQCSRCTHTESENHNSNQKLIIEGDSQNHKSVCSVCYGVNQERNVETEEHNGWSGGNTSAHKCIGCGYTRTGSDKYEYHCYNISNVAMSSSYTCLLARCNATASISKGAITSGLELEDYCASDATISMDNPPPPPNGTYTVSWTVGGESTTLRNQGGTPVLPDLPENWITLYAWGQKNIDTHVGALQNYADSQRLKLKNWGIDVPKVYMNQKIIENVANTIADNKYSGWPAAFDKSAIVGAIKGGGKHVPTVSKTVTGAKYTLKYSPGDGGWMFANSPLFSNASQTQLYSNGSYAKEGGKIWQADILYCYRLLDGKIPKNGYDSMYSYKTVTVYNSGPKNVSCTVPADMEKIDKTGYRFVGSTVQVDEIALLNVASAPSDTSEKSSTPTVTVGWDYTKSAAMVTFFLEPVELEYGHKWRDMSNNTELDQVLNHKEVSRLKTLGQEPLQFPDFYNAAEDKCIITVQSLNKFIWPGFLLKSFEVDSLSNNNLVNKTYNDETTTVYSKEKSRLVMKENVDSKYNKEKNGYASNKIAWFIYNTPQLMIEHRDFNTKNLLPDETGKLITGIQQIFHQWAKIESLMTDNIGLPHKLTIGNSVFVYKYPKHSLVQMEIYEVAQNGRTELRGILYEDERYKPKVPGLDNRKIKKITGYSGIFADYYMETYSRLKDIFNDADLFNTNKNWKIVFVYDEVEKLHVRFYDKNGNVIFTKNSDGKYISEIIKEIERTTGASHQIKDIGEYKPLAYTINDEQYNKDFNSATQIIPAVDGYDPNILEVTSGTGDKYIAIFYSTEDVLRVDYRDTDNNPIQVPPNYVSTIMIDIPGTGTFVEVPVVPGYKIKEYKINTNYNGIDTEIDGDGYGIPDVPTQISVPSTGNNQYIIVYYEKEEAPTKLIVECREESVSGDLLREPMEIPLITGENTEIEIPHIDEYIPKSWVKDGDPTENLPNVKIIVVGDPEIGTQKVIIIYVKGESGETGPIGMVAITPEDNKEYVELKANTTTLNEYEVLNAIPTSEDLYISGDVFSYKFTHDIVQVEESETIKVRVDQKYFTDLANYTVEKISSNTFDVKLDYSYYKVNSAKLFDLKSMKLENDAIKYYEGYNKTDGTYTGYTENEANFGVNKNIPRIVYNEPTDKFKILEGKTPVGELSKEGNIYVITLNDIAYVKPNDMNERFNSNSLAEVNEVLGELATVYLNELAIELETPTLGKTKVDILTGNSYTLNQKTEALKEGVNYLPFTPGRAPLYHFLEDKGLYVKESALNIPYQSRLTGYYYMIQEVKDKNIEQYNPAKDLHPLIPIAVNLLHIHTPIINRTDISVDADYEKSIQLFDTVSVNSNTRIIVLDKEFSVAIPNSGVHSNNKGYNINEINNKGLINVNDNDAIDSILAGKSRDILYKIEMYNNETEEKSIGPSFAEYKLIKFPYDVYLTNAEEGTVLFTKDMWYNLYEYLKPSVTDYKFVVPVWVEDSREYKDENGIQVLIVAENCPSDVLAAAKNNPMSVTATGAMNARDQYVLRKTINTYVIGRVYGLQIRDTDDVGMMGRITPALKGDPSSNTSIKEMPIAQKGQVTAYNLGLKLGYRFYFDLKTKGSANETINIAPELYYVDAKGNVTNKIALFYNSNLGTYTKLKENDLNIRMVLSNTHGLVNNPGYTAETVAGKVLSPNRIYNTISNIGSLMGGLRLERNVAKLPFDNILESSVIYKFANVNMFIESLRNSSQIKGDVNLVKDSTGHWYGEYYLPASTIVVQNDENNPTTKQDILSGKVKPYTGGYIVVVFKEISTTDRNGNNYLSYSRPILDSQWNKEGIDNTIILPNGIQTVLPFDANSPMAIYQVGLRANNDFETVGTH